MKADAEHTWKALRNSVNYFKSHFRVAGAGFPVRRLAPREKP